MQDLILAKVFGLEDLGLSEAIFFPSEYSDSIEVLPNVFWDSSGLQWRQPVFRETRRPEQKIEKHVQKSAYRLLKYQFDRDSRHFDQLGLIQDEHSIEIYKAFLVASAVHLLHTDESGQNHINHLVRVFKACVDESKGSRHSVEELQSIFLKDVIRDSRLFFYRDLLVHDLASWGFDSRTLELVADLSPPDGSWEPDVQVLQTNVIAAKIKRKELADYLGPVFINSIPGVIREQWKTQKTLLLHQINDFEFLPRFDYRPWDDQPETSKGITPTKPLLETKLSAKEMLEKLSHLGGEYALLDELERWQNQNFPDLRFAPHGSIPGPFEELPALHHHEIEPSDILLVQQFTKTLMAELRGGVWIEIRGTKSSFGTEEKKSSTAAF